MFNNKPATTIVFVDRGRLQFFGGSLSSILALDLPPAMVKDLEVVNRDALYTLVNQWLKQNNLGSAKLFFILSQGTYFEKLIAARGESEQETEILKFYDSVPFEELTTKVYTLDGRKLAVATNQEFLEAIIHAFTLQGHQVVSVIPAVTLGSFAAKRWLDVETGTYVLKHVEVLTPHNMYEIEYGLGDAISSIPRPAGAKQNNPRLMWMVGFLGVLLLVLIYLAFVPRP